MICEKVIYRCDVDWNQKEKEDAWVFIRTVGGPEC